MKEKYIIKQIDSSICKNWFLYKHYAHRIPPVSFAFGLFKYDQLIGVCSFGRPVSIHLKNGICGKDYQHYVYELNRLIINEGEDKNVLSYFVSKCLNQLPKPLIIVSYADMGQNHNGYIYQATNFIYTGLSIPKNDYAVKGMDELHNATLFEKTKRGTANRVDQLKAMYGDLLYMKPRDRKHRYIYFIGNKTQVNDFKNKLKYPICEYPKGKNSRYEIGQVPFKDISAQKSLFEL